MPAEIPPEECCVPYDESSSMVGEWHVFEYGYSPGAGYIIEEVPEEPAQVLQFKSGNKFSSNYKQLVKFHYYLILDDGSQGYILALYEELPEDTENIDTRDLEHSYSIVDKGDTLELWFRFCIEGCHIGLKRVE